MKLYSCKDLAKHLGVSEMTIRNYARDGKIGVLQPGGKGCMVRYYLKEGKDVVLRVV